MTDLSTTDIHDLRAWADAGYLPLPLYIEEVERRRKEQQAALSVALEALGEDVPEAKGDLFHHPV